MQELQKVLRVITKESIPINPITLLVLDATTGQNGLAQAKTFTNTLNCDGIILTKLDTIGNNIAKHKDRKIKIKILIDFCIFF